MVLCQRPRMLPPESSALESMFCTNGARVARCLDPFAGRLIVDIALQGEAALFDRGPVHAEAALRRSPVIEVTVIGMIFAVTSEGLAVEPVAETLSVAATVAGVEKALIFISSACGNERPTRFVGALRDDVDDAVHGVRPPDGSARSADHFDTIDVFEQRILHLPVGAIEKRRVDGSAIDEDQDRAIQSGAEAANSDGPMVGIDAGDFDARHRAQSFRNAGGAGAADIFAGDARRWRRGNRRRWSALWREWLLRFWITPPGSIF